MTKQQADQHDPFPEKVITGRFKQPEAHHPSKGSNKGSKGSKGKDEATPPQPEQPGAGHNHLNTLLLILGLLLMSGMVLSIPLYFIPTAVGDRFATALVELDIAGIEARLCDDTDLSDLRASIAATGGDLTQSIARLLGAGELVRSIIAGSIQIETEFNVFTGRYRFTLLLGDDINIVGFRATAGLSSPEITLQIRRQPTSACVAA